MRNSDNAINYSAVRSCFAGGLQVNNWLRWLEKRFPT